MDVNLQHLERASRASHTSGSPEERRYFVALLRAGKALPIEVNVSDYRVVRVVSTDHGQTRWGFSWRPRGESWDPVTLLQCLHGHRCHKQGCKRVAPAAAAGRVSCNCAQKAAWDCCRRYVYKQVVQAVLAGREYRHMVVRRKDDKNRDTELTIGAT